MAQQLITRRSLLRGTLMSAAGLALAACQPQIVEVTKIVEKEKVVQQTVVVEKKVEVSKEVTKIVEKQVAAPSTKTVVTYHCRAGAVVAPASEYPTHQNRVMEFREANPNIEVKRVDIANTTLADYYVKFATMVAGGTAGDVTWAHQSDCDHQRLAFEKIFAPLDDLLTANNIKEAEWFPAGIVNAKLEGKLYGLPMCTHPGGEAFLMYNETMWKAAGLKLPSEADYTIDDLRAAAIKLSTGAKDKRDVYGLLPNFSGSQAHEGWMRAYGAYSFVDEQGKKSQMNTPAALAWAKVGSALYNEDYCSPQTEALPSGGKLAMFAAGKLAAFQSGTWDMKTSIAAVGDSFKENIVLFPKGPSGRGTGNYLDTFAMLSTSKVKEAAFKLLYAFTDKRCGYLQIKLSGALPGREDSLLEKDIAADWIAALATKAIRESKPQFRLDNFRGAEHATTLNNELTKIWVGKEKPAQAFLDGLTKTLQTILDKPR